MRRFNKLLEDMCTNQNKQYSKDVEEATFKTLAERYKTIMVVTGNYGWKHHQHYMTAHLEEEDKEEDDDSSAIPHDELILLVNSVKREEV